MGNHCMHVSAGGVASVKRKVQAQFFFFLTHSRPASQTLTWSKSSRIEERGERIISDLTAHVCCVSLHLTHGTADVT